MSPYNQVEFDNLMNARAAAESEAETAVWEEQDARNRGDWQAERAAKRKANAAEARIVNLDQGLQAMSEEQDQEQSQRRSQLQQYMSEQQRAEMVVNSMTNLGQGERVLSKPGQVRLEAAYYEAVAKGLPRETPGYFAHFDERFHTDGAADASDARIKQVASQLRPDQRKLCKELNLPEERYAEELIRMHDGGFDSKSMGYGSGR
jgi:hypothetical protein